MSQLFCVTVFYFLNSFLCSSEETKSNRLRRTLGWENDFQFKPKSLVLESSAVSAFYMFDLIHSHSFHLHKSNIVFTNWFNQCIRLQFLIKLPIHWRATLHMLKLIHTSLSWMIDIHIQDSVSESSGTIELIVHSLLVTPSTRPLQQQSWPVWMSASAVRGDASIDSGLQSGV